MMLECEYNVFLKKIKHKIKLESVSIFIFF